MLAETNASLSEEPCAARAETCSPSIEEPNTVGVGTSLPPLAASTTAMDSNPAPVNDEEVVDQPLKREVSVGERPACLYRVRPSHCTPRPMTNPLPHTVVVARR